MGKALDTIAGQVTAPGAVLTAWTVNAGDSLTVRNAPPDSAIRLLSAWFKNQAAGTARIRSPRLHDNVQGIRTSVLAADIETVYDPYNSQKLIAQDSLIVEQSGSAVAGQFEQGALLVYYENLPGVDARFISADDLTKRLRNIYANETANAPGVAGGYSGGLAMNATFDLSKANTDYALLGILVSARCTLAAVRGADTGNLRVSVPGEVTDRQFARMWFYWLARQTGLPLVPVINSANKANTTVDVMQDQAGAAVTVTLVMAELGVAA